MNKQKTISLSGALVAALAVALIWLWTSKQSGEEPGEPNDGWTDSGGKQAPSWPERLPDPRSLKKPEDVSEEDWNTFLRNRAIAEASNRNILFYGKIIDQNGDLVVGASITAYTRKRAGVAAALVTGDDSKKVEHHTTTNTSGRFEIGPAHGYALNIMGIKKEGCVLPRSYDSQFMYGQLLRDPSSSRFHHPDPAKPVIFRMWKLGDLEPLIFYRSGALRNYADSNRKGGIYMDLLKKDRHNDPQDLWDCHLDVMRSGDSLDGRWHIRLRINDGGWIAATEADPFRFEAPESGYATELHFEGDSLKGQVAAWNGYVKLRGGSAYGAIRMDVYAYHTDDFAVYFNEVRINPRSSRNLQYDGTNKMRPSFR